MKPHLEFHTLDLDSGWERPSGYPAGIDQKIIAGELDEDNEQGNRTRLLRFAPGVFTTEPFTHDYWEEVFLIEGDLIVAGETFRPWTYAVRPPGASHGPFKSETGCLLLETHYYADTQ
jgi:hypothetical protein